MNNATLDSFFTTLEDIGRAIAKSARYAAGAIAAMSWPSLLLSCVLVAMLITILPLALGLFIVFLAVKLAHAALTDRATRGPATPHRPVDTKDE